MIVWNVKGKILASEMKIEIAKMLGYMAQVQLKWKATLFRDISTILEFYWNVSLSNDFKLWKKKNNVLNKAAC